MAGPPLPSTCDAAVLWVGPGYAAYRGPALGLGAHSGAVPCVVVGLDGPFALTVGEETVEVRSALVPPRTVHRVDASGTSRMIFCHAEIPPDRRAWTAGSASASVGPCAVGLAMEPELLAAGHVRDVGALLAAATGRSDAQMDPRVGRAAAAVLAEPALAHPAAEVAAGVALSTSHFLRLFARDTGTSFRRYRVWARLLRACEVVAAGGDLTRAAADAGFASPSHFSDTVRRTFGLSASALLTTGVRLELRPAGQLVAAAR